MVRHVKGGASKTTQSVRLSPGKSRRYYHAPLFMLESWRFLKEYLPYVKSRHYTDILLTPFSTPTFENNGDKPGGSPYAFADAKMNPLYTNGKQLSVGQTIKTVKDLVTKAAEKDIGIVFDVALNHVGHKPNISKDNPVFRLLAKDIEKGIVTFDQIFCAPDEKRSEIEEAKTWTDVREFRMDTEEQLDNTIKYFVKPYLTFLKKCGCRKVRLDAPHMLPPKFWNKVAPLMVNILSSPEVIIESIDPWYHYKPIYDAFPEAARPQLRHMDYQTHFNIVCNNSDPRHQLYEIETDDQNDFWAGAHNKNLTNTSVALINCTHDATDDNRQSVKTRLEAFQLNKDDFVACRRLFNALTQLSHKEIIRMHTDDGNDFHSQKGLFSACAINPAEVTTEESYSFSKDLNITHQYLHDDKNHFWYQAAHVWNQPRCALHIARPKPGFEGQPVLTFINAANEIVQSADHANFAAVVEKAYKSKKGSEAVPQEVNLLGLFSDEQIAAVRRHYGSVRVNGVKVIDIDKNRYEIGDPSKETYGGGFAMGHYSPNSPQ